MTGALRIPLALTVSAVLHLAVAAVLVLALKPAPVTPPDRIEARMRMQAAEVRQDRAAEAEAEARQAPEAEGASEQVGTATVRSERAGALAPDRVAARTSGVAPPSATARAVEEQAPALEAAAPATEPTRPVEQPAPALAAAEPSVTRTRPVEQSAPALAAARPAARPLTSRPAAAPRTAAVAAPSNRIASSAAPAPRLAAGAQPEAERLALATPPSAAIASDAPEADRADALAPPAPDLSAAEPETARLTSDDGPAPAAPEAQPESRRAPPREARGESPDDLAPASLASQPRRRPASDIAIAARAGLAWSGGAETAFDALSLATVQSFMAPKDARDAAGGDVRDGLSAMLTQYPCSRMEAAFVPETGALEIRGHVPEPALRDVVEGQLRTMLGSAIGVGNDLLVLPQPLCGVLDGVEALGLPQSTDQTDDPLVVGQSAQAKIERFTDGDAFGLDLGAADYDAYVYVDYYNRDGNVIHLIPNEHVSLRQQSAKSALRIGMGNPDFDPLGMQISAPFGRDIVVAFAASQPVYEGLRPIIEPAGAYLDWLRERIALARENDGFKGEWVYLFIDTSARP